MRLFLALELPDALRERLGGLQSELSSRLAGWRWSRPEGIHLTLRFLGEVQGDHDRDCRQSWRAAAAAVPPFRLTIGGLGSFPPRGRPRVLFVRVQEVDSEGRLERLAQAVEQAARDRGFAPERRPFRPHLTLARARRDGRPSWPRPDGEAQDEPGADPFDVDALTLFRSRLDPAGARYTVLDSYPLLGAGRAAGPANGA